MRPDMSPPEIESLNGDALDIEELERRLELSLASTDPISASCYLNSCCGSNCQSNGCGSYDSGGC